MTNINIPSFSLLPSSLGFLSVTLEILLHLALISVLVWITVWGIKKTLRELRSTAYEASITKNKVGLDYHKVVESKEKKQIA